MNDSPANLPTVLTPPLGEWPHLRLSARVFWTTLVALVLTALGMTQYQFHQAGILATTAQTAISQQAKQRLQELVALAEETARLSLSTDTAKLEAQVASGLASIPLTADPDQSALLAKLHGHLAELASQRSDFSTSLTELAQAEALTSDPATRVKLGLQRVEIFLAADQSNTLGAPALLKVGAAVKLLSDGPAKTAALQHLQVLQAELAAAQAEAATAQDQLQRELVIAQLKAKGLALSEQLRADLNADFQKRDQAQQEATTRNDPAQMAQAIQEKEAFDAKFSAELKQREEQLQQETTQAMQANPKVSDLQSAAVAAWQELAKVGGDSPWTNRIHLGWAQALWQQQNFPAAISALEPNLTAQEVAPTEMARSLLLQARISQSQAARLSGEAATAAWQQGLRAATQAHDLLRQGPLHRPALLRQASTVATTLAELHQSLGQKPAAQEFQTLAQQHLQASAQDHQWREIFWNAQSKLQQLRLALLQKFQPPLVDQFSNAQKLLTALQQWHAQHLNQGDATAAAAAARGLMQSAPDQYPWAALLTAIH